MKKSKRDKIRRKTTREFLAMPMGDYLDFCEQRGISGLYNAIRFRFLDDQSDGGKGNKRWETAWTMERYRRLSPFERLKREGL